MHSVNTRYKDKLINNAFRLQKSNKSFAGNSVRFYNKLPKHVVELNENAFKKYIKESLSKKAYYCVNDYIKDKEAWS